MLKNQNDGATLKASTVKVKAVSHLQTAPFLDIWTQRQLTRATLSLGWRVLRDFRLNILQHRVLRNESSLQLEVPIDCNFLKGVFWNSCSYVLIVLSCHAICQEKR